LELLDQKADQISIESHRGENRCVDFFVMDLVVER